MHVVSAYLQIRAYMRIGEWVSHPCSGLGVNGESCEIVLEELDNLRQKKTRPRSSFFTNQATNKGVVAGVL